MQDGFHKCDIGAVTRYFSRKLVGDHHRSGSLPAPNYDHYHHNGSNLQLVIFIVYPQQFFQALIVVSMSLAQ